MKITLFYRDGDNYKQTFDVVLTEDKHIKFIKQHLIETYCELENVFQLEDIGLTVYDIPMVQEYGLSVMDHNYVSLVINGKFE